MTTPHVEPLGEIEVSGHHLVDAMVIHPCGCIFGTELPETFVFKACGAGAECEYARYVIEEGGRQQKPTTFKMRR